MADYRAKHTLTVPQPWAGGREYKVHEDVGGGTPLCGIWPEFAGTWQQHGSDLVTCLHQAHTGDSIRKVSRPDSQTWYQKQLARQAAQRS
jgi:hypothetical protein